MGWQFVQSHAWVSPLAFAADYAACDMALLYSSRQETASGSTSFLLLDPLEHFIGDDWHQLPPIPPDASPALPYVVGYIGYEGRFHFTRYQRLFRFDHHAQSVEEFTLAADGLPVRDAAPSDQAKSRVSDIATATPRITDLASNFTRAAYEACIARTVECINAGDFYQANITRKFWGKFTEAPHYFSLFTQLCTLSPAPYSAYIRLRDNAILSSSPECFLTLDANGAITTRPIKGSAPRHAEPLLDAALRDNLVRSSKNLSENLMITDLMRNDLSQVAEVGSVRVEAQSALHSYATIHHLISTITAQKSPDKSAYDVVRACFPPGSMTGAPKRAAMEWIAGQEGRARGIYSGALGWFGGGNTGDLSVVIRTLICQAQQFEFQVGGGIVADSIEQEEWRETLTKARAIAQLLGIASEALESL